jgi:UDP-N-acetyl-D-mannosaminuronic acid dehydrogenase
VNDYKARYVLQNVLKIASTLHQPTIACLGVSFKKDVDDLRESPALMIVNQLAEKTSGKILLVEPHIHTLPNTLSQHKNIVLDQLDHALENADIVVLLVAHSAFTKEKLNACHAEKLIDVVGLIGKEHETSAAIA